MECLTTSLFTNLFLPFVDLVPTCLKKEYFFSIITPKSNNFTNMSLIGPFASMDNPVTIVISMLKLTTIIPYMAGKLKQVKTLTV